MFCFDILYTTPIGPQKINRVIEMDQFLTSSKQSLSLMIDHPEQITHLSKVCHEKKHKMRVFLKIECGYNRAGLSFEEALHLAEAIVSLKDTVELVGLYTHAGHSYNASTLEEIEKCAQQEMEAINQLDEPLSKLGVSLRFRSLGSTPVCSRAKVPARFEFHPGNYLFYDRQQVGIGSCQLSDIACRVVATVISHYPQRNSLLIDCGSTSLSKDSNSGSRSTSPSPDWALFEEDSDLIIKNFSQEISTVSTRSGKPLDFMRFKIGSLLHLMPNHSCLAAWNFHTYYLCPSPLNKKINDHWLKSIHK